MLTTNWHRTNALPIWMLAACVILFIARAATVTYTTYSPPPLTKIAWQKPAQLDTKSRDLLGKPRLYYFSDSSDKLSWIFCSILESVVFNNRELAHTIETQFVPIKVEKDGNENSLASTLCEKLEVSTFPSIVVTLPNGAFVDRAVWQSDRMLMAFLRDQESSCLRTAGYEGMRTNNFAAASTAFTKYLKRCKISDSTPRSWIHLYLTVALMHEKRTAEALRIAQQGLNAYTQEKHKHNWPTPCLRYLRGEITAEDLLHSAKTEGDAAANSAAHYFIAEKLLAEGKTDEAKKEFLLTEKIDSHNRYPQTTYARAELSALNGKPVVEEQSTSDTDQPSSTAADLDY